MCGCFSSCFSLYWSLSICFLMLVTNPVIKFHVLYAGLWDNHNVFYSLNPKVYQSPSFSSMDPADAQHLSFEHFWMTAPTSLPSDCLAPKPAARPALRARPTLASAPHYWAAPTARWRGRPVWTHPPLAQGAWAALAAWAVAAAHCTVKPQTCALTPRPPARPLASPCPPTLGPGLPVAHQLAARTHWAAKAWPVCTPALSPLICRWATTGPRLHEPAVSSPPCLRGE